MTTQQRTANRRKITIAVIILVAILAIGVAAYVRQHDGAARHWDAAVELMKSDKTGARARPFLEIIVGEYPNSPYAPRARALLGQLDVAGSVERGSHDTPARFSEESPSRGPAGVEAERMYQRARNYYVNGYKSREDVRAAAAIYEELAAKFPTDPLAADALFEAGQCYYHLNELPKAIAIWQGFISSHPRDGRVPESLYALGFIHTHDLGQPDVGRRYFDELMERFPHSSSAEAARRELGLPPPQPAKPAVKAAPVEPEEGPTIYTTPGGVR